LRQVWNVVRKRCTQVTAQRSVIWVRPRGARVGLQDPRAAEIAPGILFAYSTRERWWDDGPENETTTMF